MCLARNFTNRTLFRIGLVALILSSLLQEQARHYPQFHPDLVDGAHGFCIGIFIGLMAIAARRSACRIT